MTGAVSVDRNRIDEARLRLVRYMVDQGKKNTRQRGAIVDAFLEGGGHCSLQELLERVQQVEPGIGFATVYRTMKLLADAGVATERHFGEGQTRYELADLGDHHDHLICQTCRHIFEFEDPAIERLQGRIAERYGLRITRHRHEIYGECMNPDDCPYRRDRR